MKRTNGNKKRVGTGWTLASFALCAALVSGWVWKTHAESVSAESKSRQVKSAESISDATLTHIPVPTRQSASDTQIAHWAEKARENPSDDKAWVSLGDAFMQKARETFDLSYYGRAEASYQKALAVNPSKVEAMVGMAWVNGGRHEFEKSIEWADKALALQPKNREAYGLLGDASVELGRYDDAFAQYQQMLDIRIDLASCSRGAHILHLSGDLRKASWLMNRAIQAGGPYAENTAWCRAQLALIQFSEGAYLPAEQSLKQGLKQTPNNYALLAAMGRVKAALKQYPEAIDYYQQAIAISPQLDSVVALGDLYQVTGRKDEADRQYALVEKIHQLYRANGVRGDLQIAQFYADHNRNLPEAIHLAEEEYKTRKNVYAADTLAWCCYKNGRIAEAKQYIEMALSRKTPEALFLFHKGMIYAKAGERSIAKRALYEALSLNAHFHPIYESVAIRTSQELGQL